jgi:hypothetical protein
MFVTTGEVILYQAYQGLQAVTKMADRMDRMQLRYTYQKEINNGL